ncbi:zinc finger protein 652-like [Anthonomus grandis grandis]|uniref:zinc finger protein 652-like n=1 Tax=Anthonomus grandis grandis TaxID=2921223 RepID=UPI0021661132|nr:zinc finger protein 652-like [Anthonomus grandis grandis]
MGDIYRCRLCLKNCKSKIDIFKDDFPKMIRILAGVNVNPDDGFPKKSCLDCAKNVKSALKMRKLIIQSHKLLLEEFLANCRQENIVTRKSSQILKSNDSAAVVDIAKTYNTNRTEEGVITETSAEHNDNEPYEDDDNKSIRDPEGFDDKCSDNEWTPTAPDKTQGSSSSLIKAPDGVFFLKKRLESPQKPSSQIIVRIKKKPKTKPPPARVTCKVCNKEVQSYWLRKHMETHEYNPVTCEFCGLVSKSATALRHHVFYYHKSTADEYMCDQCAKSFRSKYRLNLHKKKEHGGTKDFECTTCGKQFFERMHLKRHIDKTHKNIRPYVCDYCGKTFKSKNHIKIHERIHSKEAPFSCNMCGDSFKMKLTLRSHLKGAHNVQEEQKVFCNVCRRGFASDVALRAHLNSRIHETEKCQYCSEMFTREYIVNHLQEVHKITNVESEDVKD